MTATAKGTTAAKPKATTARQRAGRPAATPKTQPVRPDAVHLNPPGGPSAEDMNRQLEQLRGQLASLQATQAAQAPAQPARPAAAGEDPDILGIPGLKPLRLSTTSPEPMSDERVPLFYIDDREYTIPAETSMSVALEYLHIAAGGGDVGEPMAIDYLLTELLGDEAYTAFRRYRFLKPWHFVQVMTIATRIALGALELPKAPATA